MVAKPATSFRRQNRARYGQHRTRRAPCRRSAGATRRRVFRLMELWRISNYADLKGIGGLRASGRWHFAGQPVVYLAEHPASALLEILVHQQLSHSEHVPDSYQLLRIEVPDDIAIAELLTA